MGHRIIEINGQSVVATPHEKIVHILSNAVGEVGEEPGWESPGSPRPSQEALLRVLPYPEHVSTTKLSWTRIETQ